MWAGDMWHSWDCSCPTAVLLLAWLESTSPKCHLQAAPLSMRIKAGGIQNLSRIVAAVPIFCSDTGVFWGNGARSGVHCD